MNDMCVATVRRLRHRTLRHYYSETTCNFFFFSTMLETEISTRTYFGCWYLPLLFLTIRKYAQQQKCRSTKCNFFVKNQLDALISQICFVMKLYMFRTVLLSIIRSLFAVHSAMVYVIQLTNRTRMELQFHPGHARQPSTNLYDIYQCWV
jgi:hypothetical protein